MRRKTVASLVFLFISLGIILSLAVACSPAISPAPASQPVPPQVTTGPLGNLAPMFEASKKAGVIVLGKDNGPELQDLVLVRDYLRGRGYDAQLIKELPEISMMTNEEKVRLWTLSSRFCVMVDQVAAGHIAEYVIVREQRSILAVLRPVRSGSTWMIGDDPWVDVNFIRIFEFEQTPVSALDNAIGWAEQIALTRSGTYDTAYPWRRK